MNKDLEFIATHLKEWPDDEHVYSVRLDPDGEIRFSCGTRYDFYPIGKVCIASTADSFNQQEWKDARKTITNKNNTVLFHEQLDELLKQNFGDNTEWFCHIKVGKYCIDLSCNEVSDD